MSYQYGFKPDPAQWNDSRLLSRYRPKVHDARYDGFPGSFGYMCRKKAGGIECGKAAQINF